jgi:hypothetical protein
MNCTECRENLAGFMEGLLSSEKMRGCRAHLDFCATCHSDYAAITQLHNQLITQGETCRGLSVVEPVMSRIRAARMKPERETIMSLFLKHRWGLSFGAAACLIFLVILGVINTSKVQAAAADVLTKGAVMAQNLSTIHLRGQLRTEPSDNFSYIDSKLDFFPVELWKQFGPEPKWRVEKPGRTAVMDGDSTTLFIKPDYAYKVGPSSSAFDTQWLHEIADLSNLLIGEVHASKRHGWPVTLIEQTGFDGKQKSIVTVDAKSGLFTGDYLKNKFFDTADTRRVYVFDSSTGLLESVQIYLQGDSDEKLVFQLDQIEYNQPIAPNTFNLELPEKVIWHQEMQILPDNEKYASMSPEQAAQAFLEACGREDWEEAAKFDAPTIALKEKLAGVQIIKIGTSFRSAISIINGARFVPYEIKLRDGSVRKWNLALKRDRGTDRWFVDGGI